MPVWINSLTHVAQADWKIVERGWHAHVLGEAPHKFTSALEAIKTLRVSAAQEFLANP